MRAQNHLIPALLLASILAQPTLPAAQPSPPSSTTKDFLHASPQDISRWRQLKFGMFIHWGPVSLKGTEIGWSRKGPRRGRSGTGSIPMEIYDNLYKQFNPVRFDPDQWVQTAEDAGMKYLVFTSKHHDGFSMFDSKLTDYKITNSPFKKDILKLLADAVHRSNLKLGFYYSPVDWYHPDYRTENHHRYIQFMHGQLRELCSNYGTVDIIWFDGLGGSAKDWDSENLFKMIRRLQPHVIINNRAGLPGDFDTPEQRIGNFNNQRPWETCMTLGTQWAWKPNDRIKSLEQCIHTLVRVVCGDGNLLLNVGPMPDGRIEPRQADRLRQIGQWLQRYGNTIYNTRGGPFKTGLWGGSTYRYNTIFLHILNPPDHHLTLPPIPRKILSATALTGSAITVRQTDDSITITIPPSARNPIDTIIALHLDGPAAGIQPLSVLSDSIAAGKKATASNTYQNNPAYGPDKAIDDNEDTRWATDYGTHQAWLQVDLGKPRTFTRVTINEAYPGRIQKFQLQYKQNNQWHTFLAGSTVGSDYSRTFPAVTARYVRLNIEQATEGPTIWEFRLYAPQPHTPAQNTRK